MPDANEIGHSPMSAARAREHGVWLVARLRDLNLDANRFRAKAIECGWPEVALLIEQAGDEVRAAKDELEMILDGE